MTAWGLTPEGTQPRSAEEGGQQLPEPERLPTRPVSTRAGCRPAPVSSLWRTCLRPDFSAVWAHDTARWAGKGGGRRGHRHRAQSWGQGAPHGEQALFSESQAQHQVVLVGLRGSLSPSSRDTARPRPGHHISVLSGKVNLIHNSSVSAGGRGWAPVTSREPPAVLTPPASLLYHSVLKVNCPETQKRRLNWGKRAKIQSWVGSWLVTPHHCVWTHETSGKTSRLSTKPVSYGHFTSQGGAENSVNMCPTKRATPSQPDVMDK